SFAASSLFSVSDPDGDTIASYAFWDSSGNGRFSVNGVNQGTNQEIIVTAAQLAQTSYQSGSGADLLWVRANDGTAWSPWQSFTVTAPADLAPVVTVSNRTAAHGQASMTASSLFSVSDPDGDAITTYAFWDSTGK